jgi:hypothetical protein
MDAENADLLMMVVYMYEVLVHFTNVAHRWASARRTRVDGEVKRGFLKVPHGDDFCPAQDKAYGLSETSI